MGQVNGKTDSQIQRDILEELKWNTRVKETDIGVEVNGGIVTLTGTVESWTARVVAQEAAHRVAGVLDVANDIQVKLPGSYERSDTDIAKAVRNALEWDVLVPQERIRTTVSNGIVMLEGNVDYWSQYDDAARCVRNLAGVREVRNLIIVQPYAARGVADGGPSEYRARAGAPCGTRGKTCPDSHGGWEGDSHGQGAVVGGARGSRGRSTRHARSEQD